MLTVPLPGFDASAAIEGMRDAFVALDRHGRVIGVNAALERLLGRPRTALLGAPLREIVPAGGAALETACRAALAAGRPQVVEAALPGPGRWVEASIAPAPEGLTLVLRDITSWKEAEAEREAAIRREAETVALLDALYAAAPIGLCFLDRDLRFARVNAALAAINGQPVAAHLGRALREVLPTAPPSLIEMAQGVLETGEPALNARLSGPKSADPAVQLDVVASYYPVRGPDGAVVGVGAVVQDITDRVRAAREREALLERIQAAEARYRGLFEGVADALLVAEADSRYVDANPAAERLLGYTRDELRRLRVADVMTLSPAATEAMFAAFTRTGAWRGEIELRRKDGAIVPVEGQATAVPTPAGTVYVSALRDISERRGLERQQQEFLAMVTHDLKAPLTAIRGQAQLMRRRGAYREAAVTVIDAQAARMTRLIDDLLDAARLATDQQLTLERAPVDLAEVARAAVADAPADDHPIALALPETPVMVVGDRDRLLQVLDNLLSNAVKYSPPGGAVMVTVERRGDQAWVEARDQGVGIAPEALPRLFERFYRAENTLDSPGLGLGLAICKGLIEAHGGRIGVESAPGAGSAFWFTLPLG